MQLEKYQIFTVVLSIVGLSAFFVIFLIVILVRGYKGRLRNRIELYKSIVHTQESERDRIGRNLHDEMGGLLSGLKLDLDALRYIPEEDKRKERIVNSLVRIDDAMIELRKIINDLIPHNIAQAGLVSALRQVCNTTTVRNIELHFRCDDQLTNARFREDAEINIFRIIQELLNNSLKHSGCKSIRIDIRKSKDHLIILFADDGVGLPETLSTNGIGLKNINARLQLFNGQIFHNKEITNGTEYRMVFPSNFLK